MVTKDVRAFRDPCIELSGRQSCPRPTPRRRQTRDGRGAQAQERGEVDAAEHDGGAERRKAPEVQTKKRARERCVGGWNVPALASSCKSISDRVTHMY